MKAGWKRVLRLDLFLLLNLLNRTAGTRDEERSRRCVVVRCEIRGKKVKEYYCSLTEEYPWVEDLTRRPKWVVGALLSVSVFKRKRMPMSCLQWLYKCPRSKYCSYKRTGLHMKGGKFYYQFFFSCQLTGLALIKASANLRRSEEGSGGGLISHIPPVAIPAVKGTLEQSCDKVVTV